METILSLPVATVKLLFSGIFLISAWQKFADPSGFRVVLKGYQILPDGWLGTAAIAIASLELVLGTALLTPQWSEIALLGVAALLLLYLAVMWRSLRAGRSDIDCGCSGAAGSSGINTLLLVRNLLLAAVALVAWGVPGPAAYDPRLWAIAFLGAVVLLLLFHACNQLIANHDMRGRLSHHA
jgi:uncharacterized membrane protein YphA (DoxX/SURF4 family)|tara:strand:- start:11347 stop:11892 length:546 start_codon:yes stop_codon:yes gene_type:complete